MEISGTVLRRSPISSGAGFRQDAGGSFFGSSVGGGGRRARISALPNGAMGGGGGGFSDEGHMQYYLPPVRCGGRKKEEKKRTRLVKGLSKDLSAFCPTGFGLETGDGMVRGVKGNIMTEATELLLAQLKQLRAEEKELKRKRKQEKAAMKAARLKDGACEDTTSSSSESSDSDCETVVRMSNLRASDVPEPKPNTPTEAPVYNQAPLTLDFKPEGGIEEKPGRECCSSSSSATLSSAPKPVDRIEVCMGGKCKRSGALELLEELKRRVGIEGSVVGCKCMGKCRDGPNVRVINLCNEEDPVKPPTNPLCIGVGLEDVGAIVANFFGDKKDVELLPA